MSEPNNDFDPSVRTVAGKGGFFRAPSARWARLRRTLRRAQGCFCACALVPAQDGFYSSALIS